MHNLEQFAYEAALATFDISDFINRLPDSQRRICHAMIIDGESTKIVAQHYHMTPKTVLRITRKALAPLAIIYDIHAAQKYLPVSSGNISGKPSGRVTAHR